METLLIRTKSKKAFQLLMNLSKEMGRLSKKVSNKDLEGIFIKKSIDESRKSGGYVSREKVMTALKK
ncbi:MAG: hypothetical protein WDM90_23340 [Ferruginibacter sp.]